MAIIKKVTWAEIDGKAKQLAETLMNEKIHHIFGVPKNGLYVVNAVRNHIPKDYSMTVVNDIAGMKCPDSPKIAILDDILDSGTTFRKYRDEYPFPFYVLFAKQVIEGVKAVSVVSESLLWLEFPWEDTQKDISENVIRILEYIGENPSREGLQETPKRMIKSWDKLFGGYKQNPEDVLKVFEEFGNYDEMILLKGIDFFSTCEHHFLPFSGQISVAYIPDKKVVGISKLARLVEIFSRRLQIQERLTTQIADVLEEYLQPLGVAVFVEAQHLCMTSRGVEKQNAKMVTSKVTGVFKQDFKARQEFFSLIK